MPILPGFVKGQSDNLPKIDSLAMFSFLGTNPDFMGVEIRGIKAERSGRGSYGDSAVGYVQVKRDGDVCTVKARVTPEHRIRNKGYSVTLVCDEVEESVISVQCEDCTASLGGCKHAIALLAWIHRRSEEPSVTSVACYWKPSKLSGVGKSAEIMKAKDVGEKKAVPLAPKTGIFLKAVLQNSLSSKNDSVVMRYYQKVSPPEELSLDSLILNFSNPTAKSEEFLAYCSSVITEAACLEASVKTVNQSENCLWHELRYGRVTASKAHEASRCHTSGGSLVEAILGAQPLKDNEAMKRGRMLEGKVRKEVEKKVGVKIQLAGFLTTKDFPYMGASPDGISTHHVLEIKCPTKDRAVKNYLRDGKVTAKYNAQMQMFFYRKRKALFCMAHPDFEESKEISIVEVDFDEKYVNQLINDCLKFWSKEIFPILQNTCN